MLCAELVAVHSDSLESDFVEEGWPLISNEQLFELQINPAFRLIISLNITFNLNRLCKQKNFDLLYIISALLYQTNIAGLSVSITLKTFLIFVSF